MDPLEIKLKTLRPRSMPAALRQRTLDNAMSLKPSRPHSLFEQLAYLRRAWSRSPYAWGLAAAWLIIFVLWSETPQMPVTSGEMDMVQFQINLGQRSALIAQSELLWETVPPFGASFSAPLRPLQPDGS